MCRKRSMARSSRLTNVVAGSQGNRKEDQPRAASELLRSYESMFRLRSLCFKDLGRGSSRKLLAITENQEIPRHSQICRAVEASISGSWRQGRGTCSRNRSNPQRSGWDRGLCCPVRSLGSHGGTKEEVWAA